MLKKKTNYEVKTKTKCLEDTATGQAGAVAYQTFNGEDVELSNEYHIPFHAICSAKVKISTDVVEVDDPTCQGDSPVPPTPKPTIDGADDITIAEGTSFDPMAGVSATDYEGNPVPVEVSGTVDVNVPAVYTLTYTATDSHGGTTTVRRKVTVIETDAPIINGANDVTINQGIGIDLAAGVTAMLDGEPIEFTYDPTELDKCEIGSHTVVYSATGNGKTTTVNRVVTITEIANPTISGLDTLTVEVNEEFDPLDGVSAVDGNGNEVEVTYEEPSTAHPLYDGAYNGSGAYPADSSYKFPGDHLASGNMIVKLWDVELYNSSTDEWELYDDYAEAKYITGFNHATGIASATVTFPFGITVYVEFMFDDHIPTIPFWTDQLDVTIQGCQDPSKCMRASRIRFEYEPL